MSNSFNQVTLIGHCGDAPKVITKNSQKPFAKVQMATNKSWRKDNTTHTRTDWHTVVFNNKLAEVAEKYLRKGDKFLVRGELRTRKWLDEDGKNRFSVYVQAQELCFLTPKPKQESKTEQTPSAASDEPETVEATENNEEEYEDDIPF